MKNFTKRLAVSTVAAGTLLAGAFAPGAFAADGTTATVTGGSLTITNPLAADFAGRSITGVAQTTTAALATFSVSDLTGTGAGWHVTAQATNFDGVSHNLAASSLSMSQPTATANGTLSVAPSITGAVPYVLDSGSAALVASAALNEGMGTYDFSATTLTLALPAGVFADVYASTVTISAVTAP
jgi:hypothetical protein